MEVGGSGDGGDGYPLVRWSCVLVVLKGCGAEEDPAGECGFEGVVDRVRADVSCDVWLCSGHVIVVPDCGDYGLSEGAIEADVCGGLGRVDA